MDMGSDGDEADISGRSNRHDLTATQLRQGEWPDAAGEGHELLDREAWWVKFDERIPACCTCYLGNEGSLFCFVIYFFARFPLFSCHGHGHGMI